MEEAVVPRNSYCSKEENPQAHQANVNSYHLYGEDDI